MSLISGTRLGPYEIVADLGAGGMGEVYRARDTKLNRDVAIKILPDAFAHDADRVARFTREAQTLAALNHPNIAQIYGVLEEPQDGSHVHALVMELVEGEDLSAVIARGPVPFADALPIAKQIADALEAAHEQGIVHRDLKPANIKVRPDGTVKVLDFGLAKALDADASGATADAINSPTLAHQGTMAGMIIGTAAYMAPEQARGKSVDRRADIWAFGAVLYEMLTGTRAFTGDDVSETLASVLKDDLAWAALPPDTPPSIIRLLRRCLERDPKQRLRDIGEARIELARIERGGPAAGPDIAPPPPAPPAGAGRRRALRASAAVAGAVLLLAAGWLLRPAGRGPLEPVRKLDLSIDRLVVSQGRVPVISPDGSKVAYVAAGQLRVRRLDSLDAAALVAGDDIVYPSWSPDSRDLAYVRQGRAWRISSEGGPPAELGPVPSDLVGSGGSAWTPDGQVVFAGSDTVGLWALPATGGAGRALLPLQRAAEADFHEISALPDGRGLMFTAHPKGRLPDTIAVFSGGARRVLLELKGESLRNPVYVPTGHIVYARETTNPGLWAVPFSIDRLETTGPPFLVLPGATAPSVSQDGTLCFVRADDTPVELVRVSRTGVVEPVADLPGTTTSMLWAGPTGTGFQQWGGVSLSPEGRRVALSIGFSPGQVLVYDLARGSLSSIATGTFPSRPVWLNGGERLVYGSSRDSRAWNLWSRRADGAGEEERYSTSEEVQLPSALSPDGSTLVFSQGSGPSGGFFTMPALAAARPAALFGGQVWGLAASFSPDGRFLAHESPESGRPEIYVRPFPDGGQRLQVSTGGGAMPIWARNGEIFYVSGSSIVAVPVTASGGSVTAARPAVLFQTGQQNWLAPTFDVTPDGQTLFMLRARGREQVSLILNWFDELKAKVK